MIAMANTSPPIDSAAVLGSRARAGGARGLDSGRLRRQRHPRDGGRRSSPRWPSCSEAGAIGFSDDGLPIANARVLRRALQYQRLAGGVIALHEEDPELSGDGVMHEGEVSAALGMAGRARRSRSRR